MRSEIDYRGVTGSVSMSVPTGSISRLILLFDDLTKLTDERRSGG
jgi:hypothetical protein